MLLDERVLWKSIQAAGFPVVAEADVAEDWNYCRVKLARWHCLLGTWLNDVRPEAAFQDADQAVRLAEKVPATSRYAEKAGEQLDDAFVQRAKAAGPTMPLVALADYRRLAEVKPEERSRWLAAAAAHGDLRKPAAKLDMHRSLALATAAQALTDPTIDDVAWYNVARTSAVVSLQQSQVDVELADRAIGLLEQLQASGHIAGEKWIKPLMSGKFRTIADRPEMRRILTILRGAD